MKNKYVFVIVGDVELVQFVVTTATKVSRDMRVKHHSNQKHTKGQTSCLNRPSLHYVHPNRRVEQVKTGKDPK